ncbi:sensor histidine kinase [Nocardiopsis suaedae]|uniref:Histidine kinase n=1 Tax=Nocardiopsis suaedae TaxID=3018444 RepID=A0ABT4TKR6_9ACTN|nr:histidine kinase [Nocardiopsis suaedae]MDA2804687.1 histidine kinase [Nocardiopsis suaedae]
MRVHQPATGPPTPDRVVLRYIKRHQYLNSAFALLLPGIALVTADAAPVPIAVLVVLLMGFSILRSMVIGLGGPPPVGMYRTVLLWTLVVIAIAAMTLATARTQAPWFWLLLPGIAAADVVTMRPRHWIAAYIVPIALATGVCVYVVVAPGSSTEEALRYSVTSVLAVGFLAYWESTGPVLWQRTVDANESTLRLAVTEERLRISEDLHDILGRALEVVAFKSELASRLVRDAPERAERELGEVQEVARGAVRDVRNLVRANQTTEIAHEVDTARRLLESASIRCETEGAFADVPEELSHPLGRVVREAVTNILRHARATVCEIRLDRYGDDVVLVVRNDGAAEGPARPYPLDEPPTGLESLRRHIREHRGEMTAEARGSHFTLTARLPAPPSTPSP